MDATSERIEGAGVELAVTVRGEGAATVLVHGIASDARAQAPEAERIAAAGARAVTYDRRGYGESGAPEPYLATTVEEQAADLIAVVRWTEAAPLRLVGDGFGALVVLDLLKREPALAASAVLSNPPLLQFVPEATEWLATQRARIEEALREGGPERTVETWLGDRVSDAHLSRARQSARGFLADFAGLPTWAVTRRELRAIEHPVVVATGAWTPPHIVAAADVLAELLPRAMRITDSGPPG